MRSGHVETWKGIAVAVGRSERWCRDRAVLPVDPLPAFKVGGIVRLNLAELDAWIERRRTAPSAPQPTELEVLRAENAALRREVTRLTELILRDSGVFTEAQIAAVLEVKGAYRMEQECRQLTIESEREFDPAAEFEIGQHLTRTSNEPALALDSDPMPYAAIEVEREPDDDLDDEWDVSDIHAGEGM